MPLKLKDALVVNLERGYKLIFHRMMANIDVNCVTIP